MSRWFKSSLRIWVKVIIVNVVKNQRVNYHRFFVEVVKFQLASAFYCAAPVTLCK